MIKYRVRFDRIDGFEVVKETPKQVIYLPDPLKPNGKYREVKKCDWYSWHDTWEEAKNFMISEKERESISLEEQIAGKNESLQLLKELKQ